MIFIVPVKTVVTNIYKVEAENAEEDLLNWYTEKMK